MVVIMLNEKGFMLYDALLSFILLTSMSIFFLMMINVNLQKTKKYELKIDALESMRKEVYRYAETGTYEAKTNENYYLQKEGSGICAYFNNPKYEKECID